MSPQTASVGAIFECFFFYNRNSFGEMEMLGIISRFSGMHIIFVSSFLHFFRCGCFLFLALCKWLPSLSFFITFFGFMPGFELFWLPPKNRGNLVLLQWWLVPTGTGRAERSAADGASGRETCPAVPFLLPAELSNGTSQIQEEETESQCHPLGWM